jgi:phenolic acid decarboxylase
MDSFCLEACFLLLAAASRASHFLMPARLLACLPACLPLCACGVDDDEEVPEVPLEELLDDLAALDLEGEEPVGGFNGC